MNRTLRASPSASRVARVSADGASVSFLHPAFRGYFIALKALMELMDGRALYTPWQKELLTSHAVDVQRLDAKHRTEGTRRDALMRGFSMVRMQSIVLKVADKFKIARRANLSGGEWLASRNLSLESDRFIAAFLVDRAHEKAFDDAVKEVSRRYEGLLTFKYTGPWPPYNFVNIKLKLEKAN